MNNQLYTSLLAKYIIIDVAKIILSYMNKFQLRHVASIHFKNITDIFTHNDEAYIFHPRAIHKIVNTDFKLYTFKRNIIPEKIIDDKNILITDFAHPLGGTIIMFNVTNCQKTKFPFHMSHYPVTVNESYIIIRDYTNCYTVYDLNKCLKLGQFKSIFHTSDSESAIIRNIIYIVVRNEQLIVKKYSLSGKHIEDIKFNDHNCKVKICHNEIIVYQNHKILFYDLNGELLMTTHTDIKSDIDNITHFSATSNYVYVVESEQQLNIYNRVI
jgi:hypothetical protein